MTVKNPSGGLCAAHHADHAGAAHFDQPQLAHQADEAVDLVRRAGHFEHEGIMRRVDDARAEGIGEAQRFDALVALGAVIRGDTYHFEVVSNDACRAVMEVQLETGVPVANGILTCENDDQALARMQQKGSDCAQAAVEVANLLRAVREKSA